MKSYLDNRPKAGRHLSNNYSLSQIVHSYLYLLHRNNKLGNNIEFRTTLEVSYQLENEDRIGISFGHISNANIGNKNPGVEIISLSYQKPF